jgi:hypothetical protein
MGKTKTKTYSDQVQERFKMFCFRSKDKSCKFNTSKKKTKTYMMKCFNTLKKKGLFKNYKNYSRWEKNHDQI